MGGFISKLIDPIGAITGVDGLGLDPGGAALEATGIGEGSEFGKYINPAGATVRGLATGDIGAALDPLDDFGLAQKELEVPGLPEMPDTAEADIKAREARRLLSKQLANRSGTLLTGSLGLLEEAPTKKKTLLGA